MLYHAKLQLAFQAEACSTAVYLNNRSPTAALKDKTPFQRLFGRRPDTSNLKVFGCVSYAHGPDSQRRKLDAKAHKAEEEEEEEEEEESLLRVEMFNSLKRALIILTRRLNQMMLAKRI